MSVGKSYLEEVEEALKILQEAFKYEYCFECHSDAEWYNTLSDEEANKYMPRIYQSKPACRPVVHNPDCKVGKAMKVGA